MLQLLWLMLSGLVISTQFITVLIVCIISTTENIEPLKSVPNMTSKVRVLLS